MWDADDATTDLFLKLAIGLARTLAHRERAADSKADADFVALDGLIEEIAKHIKALDSIEKAARSVKKNGDVILASAQGVREALDRQVETLRVHVAALRGGELAEN
jgi:hypothetical protein